MPRGSVIGGPIGLPAFPATLVWGWLHTARGANPGTREPIWIIQGPAAARAGLLSTNAAGLLVRATRGSRPRPLRGCEAESQVDPRHGQRRPPFLTAFPSVRSIGVLLAVEPDDSVDDRRRLVWRRCVIEVDERAACLSSVFSSTPLTAMMLRLPMHHARRHRPSSTALSSTCR